MNEQPLALLAIVFGADVAPLEALPYAGQLSLDALAGSAGTIGRHVGGRGQGIGNGCPLVVAALEESHQLTTPRDEQLLADPVAGVIVTAAAPVVNETPDFARPLAPFPLAIDLQALAAVVAPEQALERVHAFLAIVLMPPATHAVIASEKSVNGLPELLGDQGGPGGRDELAELLGTSHRVRAPGVGDVSEQLGNGVRAPSGPEGRGPDALSV